MEEEGWLNLKDSIIIGFAPLPIKYHHRHLDMISWPGSSQQEYELFLAEYGPSIATDRPQEDWITIICAGEVDGDVVRTFVMARSNLQRSKPLYNFFHSANYAFACGMTLHFPQMPGAGFIVVKKYLELGPDRFDETDVVALVSEFYTDKGKRVEIYCRLHRFSKRLQLEGLMSFAWEALQAEGRKLTTEQVITMSGIIFANQAGYNRYVKTWLMVHVKKHYHALRTNPIVHGSMTWEDFVRTLSPVFIAEWDGLVRRKTRLPVVVEEGEEIEGDEQVDPFEGNEEHEEELGVDEDNEEHEEELGVDEDENYKDKDQNEEGEAQEEQAEIEMVEAFEAEEDEEDGTISEEEIQAILKSLDDAEFARAERAMQAVKTAKEAAPVNKKTFIFGRLRTPIKKTSSSKNLKAGIPTSNFTSESEDGHRFMSREPGGQDYDDYEYLYRISPSPSDLANDSKARAVLGTPPTSRLDYPFSAGSAQAHSGMRHSSLDMETAKARAVMGINSPSHGTIAGRRKDHTLSRAAKSLGNMIRSPHHPPSI